jgi:hypothetical protein
VQLRTERSRCERPYEIGFRGVACRRTQGTDIGAKKELNISVARCKAQIPLDGRTALGVASLLDWANAALKNNGWKRSMPGLDEKRDTQRQPILKAGTISFDGSGIDCLVRNMSGDGANLEVESQIGIPDSFDLVVDSEHSNHHCHVVWRKARRIGVAFD